MKQVKKIFAFVVALVMAFGIALPAFAESGEGQAESQKAAKTITIKVPTTKTTNDQGEEVEVAVPQVETKYTIYKIFDATSDGSSDAISYTLKSGKSLDGISEYFETIPGTAGNIRAKANAIGDDGQLTPEATAALGAYVNAQDKVKEVNIPAGTISQDVVLDDYGYYYIDTTTGSVAAVTSTNPTAEVVDKNVITTVDKTLDDRTYEDVAETSSTKTFNGYITLGKLATQVKYYDKMTNMTPVTNDDGDVVVAVTIDGENIAAGEATYTVKPRTDGAEGFEVWFADAFTKDRVAGTVITLTYSGTITTNSWESPAVNEATVTSGNNDGNEQKPGEPVKVYTAQIGINKTFDDNAAHRAGFKLKDGNGADAKYYKLVDGAVTWVSANEQPDEHFTSGDNNAIDPFTGLASGTYYLEESTVPEGFNKAEDTRVDIPETAVLNDEGKATNLNITQPIENKQGTVMPSTGGIGTTIFYVVGGVMVAGAVIFLLTKRRAASNVE